jgi:RHS repeat-associated protein
VLGRVVQVKDANLKLTSFTYDSFGNLSKTIDPNNNVISVTYDALGRKTALVDPDLGFIEYKVDARGLVWKQISPVQRALNQFTRNEYDVLGRMTGRYESDLESHWIFDTATKGVGQLAEAYTGPSTAKTYRRLHSYDSVARPEITTQFLSDGNYLSQTVYDAWGRVLANYYKRGNDAAKVFESRYNNYGYLSQLLRGSLTLWNVNQQDASQRPTETLLGNSLTQTRVYDQNAARLKSAFLGQPSGGRLQEAYTYDALSNVTRRTQNWDTVGFTEDFTYDTLNRLKTSTVIGQGVQTFTFDDAGNIKSKTDVAGNAAYNYPAQGASAIRPHAIQSIAGIGTGNFGYDSNGNLTSIPGVMTGTWTSFDMPLSITKSGSTSGFVYGPEHQRIKQTRSDGLTVVYAGAQEVETKGAAVTVKTYWPYGIGVEIDRASAATELSWMHDDRLGSPIALSNETGALRERLAYDAWGKRRTLNGAPLNGTATPNSIDGVTDNRGFTGHEMLDLLDLVHMNGRIYDPLLGKFLSADPLIQDPMNGQSYNRYSYVLNNPTNLTDPTGFACAAPTGSHIAASTCVEKELDKFVQGFNKLDDKQKAQINEKYGATYVNALLNMAGVFSQNAKNQGAGSAVPQQSLADQIPGPDGKPIPPSAPYNPTTTEKVKDAIGDVAGEVLYRAQAIPGESAVVGVFSLGLRRAKAVEPLTKEGVQVTDKGLALVEQNLARFAEYAPNTAMVKSLRDSLQNGGRVVGAEANFYLHEIAENTRRLRGMEYEAAHAAALLKYKVSEFALYSEKVIRAFPSEFNNKFRAFWGIK